MVFKKLRQKLTKAKAKSLGMTVVEFEQAKKELKRKEGEERKKFLKWKIEQKYKQKRKQVKTGKRMGLMGSLEMLAGPPSKASGDEVSTMFFGTPPKKKRKRRKKKR